jgi:rsbT co-antagonist protein RsbR
MEDPALEVEALRARLADAERQVLRQEQLTRELLRASLEGFHIVGARGEIRDCNEAFAEIVGYTRDELRGMPIRAIDRRSKDAIDLLAAEMQRHGGLRFVAQHTHRDGRAIDVEVRTHRVVIDGEPCFVAFSHPIGEQLARERALRASEAKLRAVFERTAMLIALLDPAGGLLEHNRRLAELAGPLPDPGAAFAGLPCWPREADRRAIAACVRAAAGGTSRACEVLLRGAGGRPVTVALQVGPLLDDHGRCVQLLAEGYDVSELRRAEAEREAIQARLLAAQEQTIRELSTPMIPLDAGVLVVPLVGRIDRVRAAALLEHLLAGVAERRATTAILDITGVPVVDADVAAALVHAAHAVRLLGARALLTGVRPEVATTLVDLGVDLRGLVTLGTLQSGLAWARERR